MIATIKQMTEEIGAGRDTTEQLLGVPVVRVNSFLGDFKDIVRRLIDPAKTTVRTWNATVIEGRTPLLTGRPVYRERVVLDHGGKGWKETGWVMTKELVVLSVAGRVKGIQSEWERRTVGWTNVDPNGFANTEEDVENPRWVAANSKEWLEMDEEEGRAFKWNDDSVERLTVEEYLPNDDDLRIVLFNLWSVPKDDSHYGSMGLCSLRDPFENNVC